MATKSETEIASPLFSTSNSGKTFRGKYLAEKLKVLLEARVVDDDLQRPLEQLLDNPKPNFTTKHVRNIEVAALD